MRDWLEATGEESCHQDRLGLFDWAPQGPRLGVAPAWSGVGDGGIAFSPDKDLRPTTWGAGWQTLPGSGQPEGVVRNDAEWLESQVGESSPRHSE